MSGKPVDVSVAYVELLKKQKNLCNMYGVDFGKVDVFNSRIIALENNLKISVVGGDIVSAVRNVRRSMDYWENVWILSHDKIKDITPKQKSLLGLFLYLSLAEGMVSENVQIISFFLIKNGHDIYDLRKMKFIDSYKELGEIDLFIKLQFLERHGFTLLAGAVDRNLRNCIAHLDYIVEEDGTVINGKTGDKIKDIDQKIHNLGCINTVTTYAIGHLLCCVE